VAEGARPPLADQLLAVADYCEAMRPEWNKVVPGLLREAAGEITRTREALEAIAAGPTHAPGCQPAFCDCDASWEWPEDVLRTARAVLGSSPTEQETH
jgi:hypothetical protein